MMQLFVKMTCPYSQKVLRLVDALSIPVEIKDIKEGDNAEVLISLGGKRQVPFLFIPESDMRLYESSDIVSLLCQTYGGEVESFDHPVTHHHCA